MPHPTRRIRAAPWFLMAATLAAAPPLQANAAATTWRFAVQLDGRPIGTHRFELVPTGSVARLLKSEARFEVKFLGFTAYRYLHRVEEHWNGDCLHAISASTDDDGTVTVVNGAAAEGGFTVAARNSRTPFEARAQGCLLSFAYWNPAQLATQRQLLDQGTGRIEPVTIQPLPATTIDVQGTRSAVTGLRITGLKHPIDVWYAADRWVGLDTAVEDGRKLTYRLP